MTAAMYVPQFFVRQKLTMMVNRYDITMANPDGSEGQLLAFAQQKRFAFKEEVTFFSDESRTHAVFGFKARKKLDLNAGYDVTDEYGQPIGYFKKEFGASLMRSTFRIEGPGYAGLGHERSQLVAVLRRFSDVPFLRFHFDFHDDAGNLLMSSDRKASLRDKYTVTVPDQRVDFRVAAAMAVGLDALMAR
ncbi:hypothetical protein [Nocardioides sp. AE5]|uniref:hypothetical protein n=1 Tax=Nocardioides sp. AE5 TaxID=2962573 RepID=UPI002882ACDC|nr:hypothetical protein [Nocardioides sp. AE5]MDT0202768.1 hypothetical protein [Nocardioides sp. AE5]